MPHSRVDLLNAAPAGFLSFRDDGELIAVNDTLLDLLGYSRDAVLGVHVERILTISARIFYQTHLFPLVRLHGYAEEIYLTLQSSAGEPVPVLLNARRADFDDEPATHCVVIRVRERKKYEDELLRAKKAAETAHAEAKAANQAKSHYLRSLSHEIRTPINAILGYAELLEMSAGKPIGEKQMGYIGRVRQGAQHLLTLVNEILDLAKIESGAMTIDVAPAQIARAADAAFGLVEPLARERGVHLVRHEPGAEPATTGHYLGDHERVVQILINLLSNAVKFTDAGGRVEMGWMEAEEPSPAARLDGSGPWLRVYVTDTGIGIPEDRLAEIFEPFLQVETGRGGTGLGLSISRELARLMGGDLTATSRPGEGSTFSVWLKRAR